MKFRSDYVTNSSSSSFVFARLDSETLVDILKKNGFEESIDGREVSFSDDTEDSTYAPYRESYDCPSKEEMESMCTISSKEQVVDMFVEALRAKLDYYEDWNEEREKIQNLIHDIYDNMKAISKDLQSASISLSCNRHGNDICDGKLQDERFEVEFNGNKIEASSSITSNPYFETKGIGADETRSVSVEIELPDIKFEFE